MNRARSFDLILHNGRIWTADHARPWAEAIAISGGRIRQVGGDVAGRGERIDLGGRLVLPGLWDAHIHLYYWSLGRRQVQLAGCGSLGEMLDRVAAHAAARPADPWVSGWGWNETAWEEPRLPTRHDLDRVTARPSLFWRADMHTAVANTAALRTAGLLAAAAEVQGGVIERDEAGPTGILRELAINPVRVRIPEPSDQELDSLLEEGMRRLHERGVTGICDQRMKDHEDGPRALAAMARLDRRGSLRLRVSCNVAAHHLALLEGLGLTSGMGDERLRLGHVKIFADGTLGSRTAWMLEPFLGEPDNRGMPLTPPDQVADEMRRAAALGFPISIHAIGDRAIRECLDLFEALPAIAGVPHRIEHVQTIADEDLPRLARLGIAASMQPAHVLDDMDTADAYLGTRARQAYRFASLARSGALMAFGSDAPVADHDPFYGIHGAVARQRPGRMERGPWYPEERLTMEETLRAYTIGAAAAAGWDRTAGSLEPGKRADLCVLDRDLFRLEEEGIRGREVADTQVLLTLFDGEVVHRSVL